MTLQRAVGYPPPTPAAALPVHDPHADAVIRRVADQLPPDLVDDVAELVRLGKTYLHED